MIGCFKGEGNIRGWKAGWRRLRAKDGVSVAVDVQIKWNRKQQREGKKAEEVQKVGDKSVKAG